MHRRYLILFLVPVSLFAIAMGVSLLFLRSAGELDDLDAIAAAQQDRGGLYGSAVHEDVYAYKLALARNRPAKTAIVGSSRVLAFSQRHFATPMVNLGLMASSGPQLESAVDDLLRIARPEVVLLGIDFYWANPKWIGPLNLTDRGAEARRMTPGKLIAPYRWLWEGRVAEATFVRSIFGMPPALLAVPSTGWRARLLGDGYGPEGEWGYGATAFGRAPSDDIGFGNTLGRIGAGTAPFFDGTEVNPAALAAIGRTLRRLEAAGISAVTFLPPLAPSALRLIREGGARYAYVEEFRRRLAEISPHHFDALDIEPLGAVDCEFVDGYHFGQIAAARILLAMARSPVGRQIDAPALSELVRRKAGGTVLDSRYAAPGELEADYLNLGCRKPPP